MLEILRLLKTPEGQAELKQRQTDVYTRYAARQDTQDLREAWGRAQKAGAPYAALAALKQGPRASIALTEAKKFSGDPQAMFLVLLGPTGVGKTMAAAQVAVDFAARWPWNNLSTGSTLEPIRYVDSSSLTRISAFDAEAQRYADALRKCPLLILEDAGDEGTELGKGLFVELLMGRHSSRKRTVVTSNLRPEAFKARYGSAIWDRIRESGFAPNLFGETSKRERRVT